MPQPDSPEKSHNPYAAIAEPNYRAYAGGWVFSALGYQMQSMALGWEIWHRTNSALALGMIGLAQAMPVIIFALPGGHLADRRDRRTIVFWGQIGYTVASLGLLCLSMFAAPVWLMYLVMLCNGVIKSINGPARSALLPELIPPSVFHNAVTWNSGVFHASAMVGPIVAGLLIHASGAAWPVYACAAAGAFIFAMSLRFLKPVGRGRERKQNGAGDRGLRAMTAGARYIWQEKIILSAITLDLFAVLFGGASALFPVYADEILHVGPVGLGCLRAAPFIGALLMAVVLAHRPPFERSGRALLFSVAAFGVATIGFGFSTNFWLSIALLATAGAVDNISVVIRHVLVQARTPDELRGRVAAVNSIFIESSNELGSFESGIVARLFGPVFSVVSGGIGTMLVVAGVAWLWPQVRTLGRLRLPEEEIEETPEQAEEERALT
ncbi:MAG TPA: MFS transporter [Phycisphaerales bacterium]|nr:MFS transporter [Phycisphaerales bacterium]